MKGESYNYEEIVQETKDFIDNEAWKFWKKQMTFDKNQSSYSKDWLIGYKACLDQITKAFKEIMEKNKLVDDGN